MFTQSKDIKKAKLMMYLIPSAQKRTKWLKKHNVFLYNGRQLLLSYKRYTSRTVFTLNA